MRLIRTLTESNWFGRVCAWMPVWLLERVGWALRLTAAVLRLPIHLRCYELALPGADRPGRLAVADRCRQVGELFQGHWHEMADSERLLRRTPWMRVPRALDRMASAHDLVMARFHSRLGRYCFDERYLRVPEAVDNRVAIPAGGSLPTEAKRGQGGNLRVLRKAKLSWEISHREADYAEFYYQMYVPFSRARFGDQADMQSFQYIRQGFLRGGLMWIMDGHRRVAGTIYSLEGDTLVSWVGGTAGGDVNLLKRGVAPAMDVFSIELGHRLGARYYDMALSRPVLNDGVLQYKKRWGAGIRGGQLTYTNYYLRWDRYTPLIASLLQSSPLLVHDDGELSGLSVITEPRELEGDAFERQVAEYAVPGLSRLYAITPEINWPMRWEMPNSRKRDLPVWLLPEGSSAQIARCMREAASSRGEAEHLAGRRPTEHSQTTPRAPAPERVAG